MKDLLKSTVDKVLRIFNMQIPEEKYIDDAAQIDIYSPNSFTITEEYDDDDLVNTDLSLNTKFLLNASLCTKIEGQYYQFTVAAHLPRLTTPTPRDILYIGMRCLNTISAFKNPGEPSNFYRMVILDAIDKTIELSIISIASGYKDLRQKKSQNYIYNIATLIKNLDNWSNRTYEGRKVPFSFLINCSSNTKYSSYCFEKINKFLLDDASALISDGITSYFKIAENIEYKVAPYTDPELITDEVAFVPYRFTNFGNLCVETNLGIILTVQGDILFIKQKKLIFSKRNGEWHAYSFDAFNNLLFCDIPMYNYKKCKVDKGEENEYLIAIKKIYLTCLDVAFARTGGCLAICTDENINELKSSIPKEDVHNEIHLKDSKYKRYFLENIVIAQKNFEDIDRKARMELLGVDGATVITTDGNFITTGSIMDNSISTKIDDISGGARKKITIKLSQFGVAIKISADGYIECYKNKKHIF